MTARTTLPAIAAVTAALAFTAPAQADPVNPVDDSFLTALNNAGVGYNDPAATVALGQRVCPMLVEPGKSFASVASSLRGNNSTMSPEMASFFTGIAISMYCPQMMSSIGDGTLLRMVLTPGLDALVR